MQPSPETIAHWPDAVLAIGVAAQAYFAHKKGARRDRDSGGTLGRIERKLDDYQEEMRGTVQAMERRIDGAYHHLVGVDGKNGHRSRIEALEEDAKQRTTQPRGSAFGEYTKP